MSRYANAPVLTHRGDAEAGEAFGRSILTAKHTNPTQQRHATTPTYSPLIEQRPCARCGRRDGWRQIHGAGGGWLCCPSRELLSTWHDESHHECSRLCTIGGAA